MFLPVSGPLAENSGPWPRTQDRWPSTQARGRGLKARGRGLKAVGRVLKAVGRGLKAVGRGLRPVADSKGFYYDLEIFTSIGMNDLVKIYQVLDANLHVNFYKDTILGGEGRI